MAVREFVMRDKYSSLAALKADLREKRDYQVRILDRRSWATILAPHGGYIEAGTSALARATAASNYNYFDFQGLLSTDAMDLHVTSTKFRDPLLGNLLKQSCTAVSFHCMGKTGEHVIWLGGLNKELKAIVLHNLRDVGFSVNPDSPRYRGESMNNVVNLVKHKGVQLELSQELMNELFVGAAFAPGKSCTTTERFLALTTAVRLSLRQYRQRMRALDCEHD